MESVRMEGGLRVKRFGPRTENLRPEMGGSPGCCEGKNGKASV